MTRLLAGQDARLLMPRLILRDLKVVLLNEVSLLIDIDSTS